MNLNWGDMSQKKNGAASAKTNEVASKSNVAKTFSASKNVMSVMIDKLHNEFAFCSMENGDKSTLSYGKKTYTAKVGDKQFAAELTGAVRDYVASHPTVKDSAVSVLVPDEFVSVDIVNLPNMNRRRNMAAVDSTISGLYKNRDELIIHQFMSAQSKNVSTYSLTILRQQLAQMLKTAVTDAGMSEPHVSFLSHATVCAVGQLAPKMKGASYMLLDVQEGVSRVLFVAKGRITGFYPLPFGYEIVHKNKLASEDMLFDHSVAELAVLNAREKARAKQLTIMHKDALAENADEDEDDEGEERDPEEIFGDEEDTTVDPTTVSAGIKTLPKKVPRKLPKYMLRPQPKEEDEYMYENFRIFMKWVLTLREANQKLISQGAPDAVYVNMPGDMHFLFDMANNEAEENGIEFLPIEWADKKLDVSDRLAQYGGLWLSQGNWMNLF